MSTMKTAGDMLEAIRRRLAPAGGRANQVHDVDILMSMNLAKDMVYEELLERAPDRYLEKDTTLTTSAGVSEYNWGAVWKSVQAVELATSDPNVKMLYKGVAAHEIAIEGNTAPGLVFYRYGSKLVIVPAPSDAGKTITVWFHRLLDDLVKISTELTMPQGMIGIVMLRTVMDIAGNWGFTSIAQTSQVMYSQQLAAAVKGIQSARQHTGMKYSSESLREGVYD